MATVRFSNDFKNSVQDNAIKIFNDQLDTAVKNYPKHWEQTIYKLMYGEDNVKKMNALPKEYFERRSEIRFGGFSDMHNSCFDKYANGTDDILNTDKYGVIEPTAYNGELERKVDWNMGSSRNCDAFYTLPSICQPLFKYDPPLRWGSSTEASVLGLVRSYGYGKGDLLDAEKDKWADIWKEYVPYRLAIESVLVKRNKFVSGVLKIINAYSTLGPALKVLPALWDLLDEKYKERHRKPEVRNKAQQVKEDLAESVDLSNMTAQVTAHKLTK